MTVRANVFRIRSLLGRQLFGPLIAAFGQYRPFNELTRFAS
jgi:hypothetical protein